ncbi:MAG: CpsD/CapB family tyrosine-protein kinase [Acidobacteriaceae bacterium]
MSHIYEALQRAEAERKAGLGGVATDPMLERAPEHPSLISSLAAQRSQPDDAITVEVAEGLTAAPPEDFFERIPRRPWNPSMERLPALERGGIPVEQFRSLRSRVQELRDLKPLKSLLVSSGLPKEGKSFVSVNLAINLARHKSSKVLLIDADMRCSALHQYLGTEVHPGLPEYLSGKASMLEVMQTPQEAVGRDPMVSSVLENITLIPGGEGNETAADLTASKRFEELLMVAGPFYDWIVIDSPPVLLVSDAVNLARHSDAVLLVARSGVTTFPEAQRAQHELKAANVIGFVLNAADKLPMSGNYYYRYQKTAV